MKITKISKSFSMKLPTAEKFKMEDYFVALEAEVTEKESIAKANRELMNKCVWLIQDDIKRHHNKVV